jgi:lipoprotein-anchoring transpeptidase ErfK/SrfK
VETIKTAVVVVLLLAVLYGVYVVLSKPDFTPPNQDWPTGEIAPPKLEMGRPADEGQLPAFSLPKDDALAVAPTPIDENTVDVPATPMVPQAHEPGPLPDLATIPGEESHVTDKAGAEASPMAEPLTERSHYDPVPSPEPSPNPDNAVASAERGAPYPADPAAPPEERPSVYGDTGAAGESEFRSLRAFENAWNSALAQLDKAQWSEALLTLSLFYNNPELTGEERQRLIDLLDPLAGKVIYSPEHTLDAPYQVQANESLVDIAQRFRVPVQLLQNINGLQNPYAVQPGMALKVVPGPFRAEVDLKKSELVLFLGKYYAGRFPISVGRDPYPQPAPYAVQAKEIGRVYQSANGVQVAAGAPDNPYGNWWIDLGQGISIHGSPESLPTHGELGCISLSTADAADIFGILSVGSQVLIR